MDRRWRQRATTTLLVVVGAVALAGGFVALKSHRTFLVSEGRTFYVSSNGNDRADGRSPARAWRTLARVGSQRLNHGDRVLLAGGDRFAGPLRLDSADAGDAESPVVVASYGAGRATIEASPTEPAVSIHNTAGVVVRDLVIAGAPSRSVAGISFYNDLSPSRRLDGVTVERVEVSGFSEGIAIGSAPNSLGFARVRIEDSVVHHNLASGLVVYGHDFDPAAPVYSNEDVSVSNVEAYGNSGRPNAQTNSGNGIVISSVTNGLVDRSTAHDNGWLSDYVEGPIGIWTYNSTGVVIQNSLSYRNRSIDSDGGGFGLDKNVSGSTLQYNLSYDNDGAGFLVFGDALNRVHTRNTLRFNISSHDSRLNDYHGGISVIGGLLGPGRNGGITDTQIYQNTLVMGPLADGRLPAVVKISDSVEGVELRNNIFISVGAVPFVRCVDATEGGVALQGNDYFNIGGRFAVDWAGSLFGSLQDWRTRTGQETVAGSATGLTADPGLADPNPPTGVTHADQLTRALGFALRPGSPMIGAGLAAPGYSPGPRDYFGVLLRSRADIGASHFPGP